MHCRILYTRLRERCSVLLIPADLYTIWYFQRLRTLQLAKVSSITGIATGGASQDGFSCSFWMNEWIFYSSTQIQYSKTVKSRTVSTGQRGSKSAYNGPKRYVNEETRYSLVNSFCRTIVSLFVVFSFRHSHTYSELHLKADGVSVSAVWNLQ